MRQISLAFIVTSLTAACWGAPPKETDGAKAKEVDSMILATPLGARLICARVNAGAFRMGKSEAYLSKPTKGLLGGILSGSSGKWDAGPEHDVKITKSFFVYNTKVSRSLFCEFLNSTGDPEKYIGLGPSSGIVRSEGKYRPFEGCFAEAANTVTFDGAGAFCKWLGGHVHAKVRLPTEAEWEYVARGPEGRDSPWSVTHDGVDYGLSAFSLPRPHTLTCLSHPYNGTAQGVFDLIGPTGEWVSDWYMDSYDVSKTIDPVGPGTGQFKVVRGRYDLVRRDHVLPAAPVDDASWFYGFRFVVENQQD